MSQWLDPHEVQKARTRVHAWFRREIEFALRGIAQPARVPARANQFRMAIKERPVPTWIDKRKKKKTAAVRRRPSVYPTTERSRRHGKRPEYPIKV
jgi:hypothetical protein